MDKETVTASEIAEFVYCPGVWRLAQLGHESANQLERQAGTAHHSRKAVAERVAGGSIRTGWWPVALALAALAAWWFLR